MPKPHVIQKGDTLARLAERYLGDRKRAADLAGYNGLLDAKAIVIGQVIHFPPARELRARPAAPRAAPPATRGAPAWPPAPRGLPAIIQTFGNLWDYVGDGDKPDPRWEGQFMVSAPMPFPMALDWAPQTSTSRIRCHRLVAPVLQAVFADIVARGLQGSVRTYGGGYNWRMKRGQSKPSTHSWGIAIDLNARTNAMGTAGDMDPALVALFESYGFTWGGRWTGAGKDPMHFQYCSGY